MISQKMCFSKEVSRRGQHEFKNDDFGVLEFQGPLMGRVFSFCWRLGVPSERPRLLSWQIVMDILDVV